MYYVIYILYTCYILYILYIHILYIYTKSIYIPELLLHQPATTRFCTTRFCGKKLLVKIEGKAADLQSLDSVCHPSLAKRSPEGSIPLIGIEGIQVVSHSPRKYDRFLHITCWEG